MGKNMEFSYLLDFYGGMLTEKQRSVMEQYYNDDLSLAEIADNFSISRQGVRDAIKHGEEMLLRLEQSIGAVARHRAVSPALERLHQLAAELRFRNRENALTSLQTEQMTVEMLELIAQIEEQEELTDGI